jgi:hypothetical protein
MTYHRQRLTPEQSGAASIELTKGCRALVDAEDYERLNAFKWYAHKHRDGSMYAVRMTRIEGKQHTVQMHREILGLTRGDKRKGDHENGDTLDNRRENLRVATNAQNGANRVRLDPRNASGFLGVTWHKTHQKWAASIKVNGTSRHLGYFTDPKEAAQAYNIAAQKHFGEFASNLNKEVAHENP